MSTAKTVLDVSREVSPPKTPTRKHLLSELILVTAFLAIIATVPVTQTCIELARGERVQATDVFRMDPTSENLRDYEHILEEKSVFERTLRPRIQATLFATLRETGAKAVLGRDNWLFYRPDVRYLVEPDRPDVGDPCSKWVRPGDPGTRRESVINAIVQFRDQLKTRGIALLIVPIPGKPSVYPDQLTAKFDQKQDQLRSPSVDFLKALQACNVQTTDLFPVFQQARRYAREPDGRSALYLRADTHWTPVGAKMAAEAVARKLTEMGYSSPQTRQFQTRAVSVNRHGDIVEMMQTPGATNVFAPQEVACEQVIDSAFGPLLPAASEPPGTYRFPGGKAEILVLGDSFCRIYQFAEPQSLGSHPQSAAGAAAAQGSKRLLPGSAGFVSHLAKALQAPVDCIYSDGGAATDCRRKLSTNPEILETKKVVVWTFVERDIALGQRGWETVDLPPSMN